MQNLNVNFRANLNVRGMNVGPRNEDAALLAEIQRRTGGMQVDAGIQVRGGGGGVRANISMRADSFGGARGAGHGGSVAVTGMGDLRAEVSARYGNQGGGFRFEAQVNRQNFRARMDGANNIRNQAEVAVNLGMMQPQQGVQFQAQINNFSNFANFQMGGADAQFQNHISMMLGQHNSAQVNVNFGGAMEGQMALAGLQQTQAMLGGLGYAQGMLAQQFGGLQQDFGMFQGQVSEQFGAVNQALGQIGSHAAQQDQMLNAHTNGLGKLFGEVTKLNTDLGGLNGLLTGLDGKLGSLSASVDTRFGKVDEKLGALSTSTDSRFAGVNDQLASLMSQLGELRSELKAAREENSQLKTTVGKEATRLDGRIDTEAATRQGAITDLGGRITSETATRESQITGLQGKIGDLDKRMQTADATLKGQLEAQKAELTAQLTALGAKVDTGFEGTAKEISGLKSQIADLDTRMQTADATLRGQLEQQKAELTAKLGVLSTRVESGFEETNKQIGGLKTQIADLDTKMQTADAALRGQLEQQRAELSARLNGLTTRVETGFAELNTKVDKAVTSINSKIDSEVSRLDASDVAIRNDLNEFRAEYNATLQETRDRFAATDTRINEGLSRLERGQAELASQLRDTETRLQASITAGDTALQGQLNEQRTQIQSAQTQINQHTVQLRSQQSQISTLRTDVNSAISIGTQALGEARGAQATANAANSAAANLREQVTRLDARIDVANTSITNIQNFNVNINNRVTTIFNQVFPPPPPPPPPRRRDPIILDLANNGINLSGQTKTNMLSGEMEKFNWTKKGTDDAFLMVDASSLRQMGFDVKNANGTPVDGNVMFKDGLQITGTDGQTTTIKDGWQMLGLFDGNKDGKVNASDPAWQALSLFTDKNGDGTVGRRELQSLSSASVASISLQHAAFRTDSSNNLRSDGTWTTTMGQNRLATDAFLAQR